MPRLLNGTACSARKFARSKPIFSMCFPTVTEIKSWNCQVWFERPCGNAELTPIPAPDRSPLPLMVAVGPAAAGLAAVAGSRPKEKSIRFQAKRSSFTDFGLNARTQLELKIFDGPPCSVRKPGNCPGLAKVSGANVWRLCRYRTERVSELVGM